jgi:hypothetical protein
MLGTNGKAKDALVFSKCTFNESLRKNILNMPAERVFVAIDALPLRSNILKPYSLKRPSTTQTKNSM